MGQCCPIHIRDELDIGVPPNTPANRRIEEPEKKEENRKKELVKQLRAMTEDDLDEIHEVRYSGIPLHVRITNVYDGDTFDIVFYDPSTDELNRHRCRAFGYDAPEMKPLKSKVQSASERARIKKAARAARAKLIEWISDGDLIGMVCADKKKRQSRVSKDKKEKFGRTLISIYKFPAGTFADGEPDNLEDLLDERSSLCAYMLKNTESVEYYGGTKD